MEQDRVPWYADGGSAMMVLRWWHWHWHYGGSLWALHHRRPQLSGHRLPISCTASRLSSGEARAMTTSARSGGSTGRTSCAPSPVPRPHRQRQHLRGVPRAKRPCLSPSRQADARSHGRGGQKEKTRCAGRARRVGCGSATRLTGRWLRPAVLRRTHM
ncbi:hypothetical protein GY45DRAFT_249240 [Cubamyces sp. BRFM 1775]|nr:hypothetical protein GY45DRAFT_249240 [Cubamyces sp. BRFM 1775]